MPGCWNLVDRLDSGSSVHFARKGSSPFPGILFVNSVSAPVFPHEVFTPAKQGKPIPGSKSGFLQVLEYSLLIKGRHKALPLQDLHQKPPTRATVHRQTHLAT